MTKSLWVGQGVGQDRYPGLNHLGTNVAAEIHQDTIKVSSFIGGFKGTFS